MLSAGLVQAVRVLDGSGDPLVGYPVQAQMHTANDGWRSQGETDAEGRALLKNLRSAVLTIEVFSPDWTGPLVTLGDVRARSTEMVITVPAAARLTARVHGRVLDRQGRPPRVLRVLVHQPGEPAFHSSATDASTGAFTSELVAPGDLDLLVSADSSAFHTLAVPGLADGEDRDLGVIVPPEQGRLRVRLRIPEGLDPGPISTPLTDSQKVGTMPESHTGTEIVFPLVYPGRFELLVRGGSIVTQEIPITIEAGVEQTRDVDILTGVSVEFRFKLPAGSAAWERLEVTLVRAPDPPRLVSQYDLAFRHPSDGWLTASEVLLAGVYDISALADGRPVLSDQFVVPSPPAEEQQREFLLSP